MTVCTEVYQHILFNAFRSLRLDSIIFYKDSILSVRETALERSKIAIDKGKEIEETLNNENAYLKKQQKTLTRQNTLLKIVCGVLGLTTIIVLI